MSFVLAWAVKCTCAFAGLSIRQSQQKIKVLNGINDPMMIDFISVLQRCKDKKRSLTLNAERLTLNAFLVIQMLLSAKRLTLNAK
jgi:hypothetical protein